MHIPVIDDAITGAIRTILDLREPLPEILDLPTSMPHVYNRYRLQTRLPEGQRQAGQYYLFTDVLEKSDENAR